MQTFIVVSSEKANMYDKALCMEIRNYKIVSYKKQQDIVRIYFDESFGATVARVWREVETYFLQQKIKDIKESMLF